jgi:hypothetical protein
LTEAQAGQLAERAWRRKKRIYQRVEDKASEAASSDDDDRSVLL